MRTKTLLVALLVVTMMVTGLPVTEALTPAPTGVSLSVTSPTTRSFAKEPTVTVAGTTNGDSVSVVDRTATITAAVAVGGKFNVPVVLSEGRHVLRVIARRGDQEASSMLSMLIDLHAPRIASFAVRRARFSTSSKSKRRIASYRVSERARVVAVITTRRGRRPYVLRRTVVRPGRRFVSWNGRTRRGRLVKPGVYRLTLIARDLAGNIARRVRRIRVLVSNDSKIRRITKTALRFRGVRYVWGGMSPRGFDCSGFVGYVYRLNGIGLPRTSREMAHAGRRAGRNRLRAGDILLFNTNGSGISHAGLYLGRGRFIQASSGKGRVVISRLRGGYYGSRLVMARRVVR